MNGELKKKCLNPYCDSVAVARGLCGQCYDFLRQNVVFKQVKTWEQLEQEGKCTPRTKGPVSQFQTKRTEWLMK